MKTRATSIYAVNKTPKIEPFSVLVLFFCGLIFKLTLKDVFFLSVQPLFLRCVPLCRHSYQS